MKKGTFVLKGAFKNMHLKKGAFVNKVPMKKYGHLIEIHTKLIKNSAIEE